MKLYRSKLPWFSGFANEPEPEWPHDYEEPEEIEQRGTGNEALDNAFSHSVAIRKVISVKSDI